jgi:conjugal transfer mating pair stabilization protein TraN
MRRFVLSLISPCLATILAAESMVLPGWVAARLLAPRSARADAMTDAARQGADLGRWANDTFVLPEYRANIDDSDPDDPGRIQEGYLFKSGPQAGRFMPETELFPGMRPGSMDGALQGYGDNESFGAYINNVNADLAGQCDERWKGTPDYQCSAHADAYKTLHGGRTSGADLFNDPIFRLSKDTLHRGNGIMDSLMSTCDTGQTVIDGSKKVHIPDERTCSVSVKVPACEVTREIQAVGDPVIFTGGQGLCCEAEGEFLLNLKMGNLSDYSSGVPNQGCPAYTYTMNVRVLDASRIKRVYVYGASWDSVIDLKIDGQRAWSPYPEHGCSDNYSVCQFDLTGTGTCNGTAVPVYEPAGAGGRKYPDITPYLKKNGDHVVQLEVWVRNENGSDGSGGIWLRFEKTPNITETFIDEPAGCRRYTFDHWPPPPGTPPSWTPDGSKEDQASTAWWQCLDADFDRAINAQVTVRHNVHGPYLDPILPEEPKMPPAPICFHAKTRQAGSGNMQCWTDGDGYQHCPAGIPAEGTDCGEMENNPACAFVREECVDGARSPYTGECYVWSRLYDCGYDQDVLDIEQDDDDTICGGALRCVGTDCFRPPGEDNTDFGAVAGMLGALNFSQMEKTCLTDSNDNYNQDIRCELFRGDAMECKKAVAGTVDCCDSPGAVGFADYLNLMFDTWSMRDELGLVDALTAAGEPFYSVWRAIADGSGYLEGDLICVPDTLKNAIDDTTWDLGLGALKQEIMNKVGQWVADEFGEEAFHMIFEGTVNAAGEATVTGISSVLADIVSVIGWVKLIYDIAVMIARIVFECTDDEYLLNVRKQMKLCHYVGNYCNTYDQAAMRCMEYRDAYCCFNSPLARLIQQQARPQLGKTFGRPEQPFCNGLTPAEVARVDWTRIDFSEWLGLITAAGKLPKNYEELRQKFDISALTRSKRKNQAPNYDVKERIEIMSGAMSRSTSGNADEIRQRTRDGM